MQKYFINENVICKTIMDEKVITCTASGYFNSAIAYFIPSVGYNPPKELREGNHCFSYSKTFPVNEGWTIKEIEIFCKNKVRMQMESKKSQLLRTFLTQERVTTEYLERERINSDERRRKLNYSNKLIVQEHPYNNNTSPNTNSVVLKSGDYVCFQEMTGKVLMGFVAPLNNKNQLITKEGLLLNPEEVDIIGVYRGGKIGFKKAYNLLFCSSFKNGSIPKSEKPHIYYLTKNASQIFFDAYNDN